MKTRSWSRKKRTQSWSKSMKTSSDFWGPVRISHLHCIPTSAWWVLGIMLCTFREFWRVPGPEYSHTHLTKISHFKGPESAVIQLTFRLHQRWCISINKQEPQRVINYVFFCDGDFAWQLKVRSLTGTDYGGRRHQRLCTSFPVNSHSLWHDMLLRGRSPFFQDETCHLKARRECESLWMRFSAQKANQHGLRKQKEHRPLWMQKTAM